MHFKKYFLLLCLFSLTFSFAIGQCIVEDKEAFDRLSQIEDTELIAGKWQVNLRGSLFYGANLVQSDYQEYPLFWYILPKGDGYQICGTKGFEKETIKGVLIKDETIEGQFYFYQNEEPNQITLGHLVDENIMTFHFNASKDYIKQNFSQDFNEEDLSQISLLLEYILTRAD